MSSHPAARCYLILTLVYYPTAAIYKPTKP